MVRRRLLALVAVAAAALIITAGFGGQRPADQAADSGPAGLSQRAGSEHLSDSIVLGGSSARDLGSSQVRSLRSPWQSQLLRIGFAMLAAAALIAALKRLRSLVNGSATAAELWIAGARPGRGPPAIRTA